MLQVVFYRVHAEQLDRLRRWMRELMRRQDEVRTTFAQEGVQHELAYLVQTAEGPVLVYAVEADDPDHAYEVFRTSPLPIDREHKQIMSTVLAGPAPVELLYEVRLTST